MDVRTLWVDYSDPNRPGELVPNIVLAVDEHLHDENPAFWDEQKAKLEAAGVLEHPHREIILQVSPAAIERAFDAPKVTADVVES